MNAWYPHRTLLYRALLSNLKNVANKLSFQVAAISEQASATSGDSPEDKTLKKSSELKSFDMHSVVSATEDLLLFILSEKGQRVRVFLLQDIIRVADIFLEEEAFDFNKTINLRVSNHRNLPFSFFSAMETFENLLN